MSAMQFDTDVIEIGHNADDWGPFAFNLEPGIPGGTAGGITVSSIVARTYLGRVVPKDDLSDETETTSELVVTAKSTVASSYIAQVYFDLPSTTAWLGVNHTLVIEYTLSNAAKHSAYFYKIKVVKESS